MGKSQTTESTVRRPLRLWPGVVTLVLQWPGGLVFPVVVPDAAIPGEIGGVFGGRLAIIVSWAFLLVRNGHEMAAFRLSLTGS